MEEPGISNSYQRGHVALILRSFYQTTGRHLVPPESVNAAEDLFLAPFFVASHGCESDPILNYGNRCALDLFEMSWEVFTTTPSRFTAETPERAERARLLERVAARGYIDDYTGVRISSTGRRFSISAATVWNLSNAKGRVVGQAATFAKWEPLGA